MNKSDIKLLIIIVILSLIGFMCMFLSKNNSGNEAIVYYDNKEILKIDLTLSGEREYTVKGYNGDVVILTSEGRVKVIEENSPYHLCSKQGFIKESYESIVCLPNKITIKIVSATNIDAEV